MRYLSKSTCAIHGIKETDDVLYTRSGFGICKSNSKMGPIPSFSLTPIVTCDPNAPCYKDCYAVKIGRIYNQTSVIWDTNARAISDLDAFITELTDLIKVCGIKVFRWHVGGDFANVSYFKAVCKIAELVPDCEFFTFTKKYAYVEQFGEFIPRNLNVILSAWGDYHPNPLLSDLYAVSYVVDEKSGMTAPADSFICQGRCWKCQKCIRMRNGHIAFHKH